MIEEAAPAQAPSPPASGPRRGARKIRPTSPRRLAFRRRQSAWLRLRADVLALGVFLALFALTMWHRVAFDNWLLDYDILTFFLPWYGVLGERLRDFDIPGWTRYFSAGAPLAGDPSAGWMYVPVMVAFTIATGITAFKLMVAIQILIGGFATYALGRCLGLRAPAALLSTIAFALGPFLYGQTSFTTVAAQVSTWIPLGLLAVELSLRSDRWASRVSWWALAGFAISQMAVAWPGQGMVNGMLIVAGWIGYRTLLWPVDPALPWRARAASMLTTGLGVLALSLALGAAGLLPRLSVNRQSSIAGGDYSNVIGGNYEASSHDLLRYVRETVSDEIDFRPLSVSGALIVLALLAPLIARMRHGVPFFLGVYVVAVVLAFPEAWLHQIFYFLPTYESIHEHSPRRFLWIVSFAPAMLAGATLQSLLDRRLRPVIIPFLVVPLAVAVVARHYLLQHGIEVGPWLVGSALVATLLVLLASFAVVDGLHHHASDLRRIAVAGLIGLVFLAPTGRDIMHTVYDPTGALSQGDQGNPSRRLHSDPQSQYILDRYMRTTDPGTAAAFLQARRDAGELFRYVGYAGRFYPDPQVDTSSYSSRRLGRDVMSILVSGRAGTLQLGGIQVYNPTHLAHFAKYVDAMNGGTQDYHWLDPFPHVLAESALLDMLNVRYIIVARSVPPDGSDYLAIATGRQIAYQDAEVIIYENAQAYERAWIVHDVRAERGTEGLLRLASGSVDGRHVAFVDGEVSAATPPEPGTTVNESVTITEYRDDELSASVTAASPGLVVFSEVYADGWRAYVNGEEVAILRTNGALRGVPVPAGEHTIEMRYDPVELRVGLWTTGITGMALLALAVWNGLSLLRGASRATDASAPLTVPAVEVVPVPVAESLFVPPRKRIGSRQKGRRSAGR